MTTTYIIAEAHALMLHRVGHAAATSFLRSTESPEVEVLRPVDEDERAAREIIYRYTDKDFSLTDAISFATMERLRLDTVFSFDRDFERYGFTLARL